MRSRNLEVLGALHQQNLEVYYRTGHSPELDPLGMGAWYFLLHKWPAFLRTKDNGHIVGKAAADVPSTFKLSLLATLNRVEQVHKVGLPG